MPTKDFVSTLSSALAGMELDIDMRGGAGWMPLRDPKKDYSRWGVWEAWLFCRIGHINPCLVGPVPTGDWVAWNSQTGQVLGFKDLSVRSAQWQAEVAAVSQNRGKPTRVVNPFGDVWESEIRLSDVERMLGPVLAEFEASKAESTTVSS